MLRVKPGTLRRWCRQGMPHQPGRRGRGHALLVRVADVRAWRQGDADALRLAQLLPARIAAKIASQFDALDYPNRAKDARIWTVAWFCAASAALDALRELDSRVPEISALPPEIERLKKIAENVRF